jgi:hypothetical protein
MEIEMVEEMVSMPKELNDVRMAVSDIVRSVITAREDGFELATDIPAIVMASYMSLVEAIEGIDKIPSEVREKMGESLVCAALLGADVLKQIK